mmetsp:Transcript_10925/g.17898  ORF Transcript_10925/g.17898 Transcript_10925/m.17898 type:complete len:282 (-) Transcript_10925:515-1360(-)|eukprot:CAMPEP_0203779814 /NCGR_PEP_ID=MMETSP0099_2-20121227/8950_1 /ASSEMBLY_ACC=CAM_ASM_000209 /TAXON_ID=96639 /ORGANISM=" , Strain NY0313808BC1" /LENGTH=281 /DNA_ID=CAMNT_0050679853 /DNA_START=133 /DNA_END=978 /DNA_ORIENTATION=-
MIGTRELSRGFVAEAKRRLIGKSGHVCCVEIGDSCGLFDRARRHAQGLVEEVGLGWKVKRLGQDACMNEVLSTVGALNVDQDVRGIVIARPVPSGLSIKGIQQAVHPLKDIEGMSPTSIGRVVYGASDSILWPCTAKASVEVIRRVMPEGDLRGVEVLIVGRSDVVVKPVSSILHREGATVTVCTPDIPNFAAYSRGADVVITSAGTGVGSIRGDMLKPGSVLLDLGLNHRGNEFIGGDADLHSCLMVAGHFSSLAHGVGVVRSSVLCLNLATAIEMQDKH